MAQETGVIEQKEGEGVINLSTAEKDVPPAPALNGNIQSTSPCTTSVVASPAAKTSPKRKVRSTNSMLENHVPLPMMVGPQRMISPQQLEQLLQQGSQGLTPHHLQQMIHQQSLMLQHQGQHKFQEQVVQQLQEQLQLNLVQQTQIMQQMSGDKSGKNAKQLQAQLQQLGLQQQQVMQQIQLHQRQLLLTQGMMGMQQFPAAQAMMPVDMQQLWKEMAAQSQNSENKTTSNGVTMAPSPAVSMATLPGLQNHHPVANGIGGGLSPNETAGVGVPVTVQSEGIKETNLVKKDTHALYGHGVCKWPGCDTPCEDITAFLKHLNNEHQLDDRSTAQARVQMQVVNQLELQLNKERERLQAMMQHLHMKPQQSASGLLMPQPSTPQVPPQQAPQPPPHTELAHVKNSPPPLIIAKPEQPSPQVMPGLPLVISAPISLMSTPMPHTPATPKTASLPSTPRAPSPVQQNGSSLAGPMRRRVSDKCSLPISAEIQRNRDFYKTTDVRPPFTYASLIRQAIVESPDKQLTLNEIYQWFMGTFAFFRKNQATWKNAVRHNLSLHKCFMRVENVKGAVWTVDEIEFYKRRPQKMSGNIHLKSPSFHASPGLYGESLNASLRAALAESNLPLLNSSGTPVRETAQDLSMPKLPDMTSGDLDDPEGHMDMVHNGMDNDEVSMATTEPIHISPDMVREAPGLKQEPNNESHLIAHDPQEQYTKAQYPEAPPDLVVEQSIVSQQIEHEPVTGSEEELLETQCMTEEHQTIVTSMEQPILHSVNEAPEC